jgi:hypothetical protein
VRQLGREDLDGDLATEPRVAGAVDLAHSAGAERRQDFVRSNARTWIEWQGGRVDYTDDRPRLSAG